MHENHISAQIVDAAIEVHRHLGPGLLEKIYQEALAHELDLRGMTVKRFHAPLVKQGIKRVANNL